MASLAPTALERYDAQGGRLLADESQRAALHRLDELHGAMREHGARLRTYAHELERWRDMVEAARRQAAEAEAARRRRPLVMATDFVQRARRWLAPSDGASAAADQLGLTPAERAHPFWQTGLGAAHAAQTAPLLAHTVPAPPLPPPPPPPAPPRGLFLHGDVGVGKTMLMDLFYESVRAAGSVPCLRRVHYNAFMLEVSARLHSHSGAPRSGAAAEAARAAGQAADPEAEAAGVAAAPPESGHGWHVLGALVEQLLRERPRPALEHDATATVIAEIAANLGRAPPADGPASGAGAAGVVPLAPEALGTPLSAGLLCFDELQMMDVADATVVCGVLDRLVAAGWVIVATCNRSLDELRGSSQHRRHPQAAFGEVLARACEPVHLRGTNGDYRAWLAASAAAGGAEEPARDAQPGEHLGSAPDAPAAGAPAARTDGSTRAPPSAAPAVRSYLHPLCEDTHRELARAFELAAGVPLDAAREAAIPVVFGRTLRVPRQRAGAAWFRFDELCDRPLGAADFVAIASHFHTVCVEGVPRMSAETRDRARRFITLVDQLYNARAALLVQAEAPLEALFTGMDAGGEAGAHAAAAAARMDAATLEGLEFEGESGKSGELGTLIGNTNAPLDVQPAAAVVSADSRKRLVHDATFTGADERFAFRRARSRILEMGSASWRSHATTLPPATDVDRKQTVRRAAGGLQPGAAS